MAQKLHVQLQDEAGNVYYMQTDASSVFLEDGTTVEATLKNKVEKTGDVSNTVVNTFTTSIDSFPPPDAKDKQSTLWGKIVKWQSDCLGKFGNYVLKTMLSNQQINDTNRVPTSALAYVMQQAITKNQTDISSLNAKTIQRYADQKSGSSSIWLDVQTIIKKGILSGEFSFQQMTYDDNPVSGTSGEIGTVHFWKNSDNYVTVLVYNRYTNTTYHRRFVLNEGWKTEWEPYQASYVLGLNNALSEGVKFDKLALVKNGDNTCTLYFYRNGASLGGLKGTQIGNLN